MIEVSIQELKRRLSSLIAEAAGGASISITKHKRPVAELNPPRGWHVHEGPLFGKGRLAPLFRAKTGRRYLEVLMDDRRGKNR